MPGTSPGMTVFASNSRFCWLHFHSNSEEYRETMRLEG